MSIVTDTAEIAKQQKTTYGQTLREIVEKMLANYFGQLAGATPSNVYDMVITEVEAPLLEAVMRYTRANQSKAAIILGLSRGTLRKKLKFYGIDKEKLF
jgi:Fis family transcriptional regulator